jgi:formate dehydrogenase subunit delta
MANQIARNLATHANPAAAVADHVASFWDPRMRAIIFDHMQSGGAGLDPVAAEALAALAQRGPPDHQTESTRFNRVDEGGGSDAG